MDMEATINRILSEQDIEITLKKVNDLDAKVVVTYSDIAILLHIPVNDIYMFLLNRIAFKGKDIFDAIATNEGIPEGDREEFDYRLAGRLMTILSNDHILRARRQMDEILMKKGG